MLFPEFNLPDLRFCLLGVTCASCQLECGRQCVLDMKPHVLSSSATRGAPSLESGESGLVLPALTVDHSALCRGKLSRLSQA
jgi:hypothetical protein